MDIRESRSLSTRDENPTSAFSGSLNMGREGTKLGLHAPPRKSMRRKVFFSRSTRNTDSYLNLIGIGAPGYATLSMALALQMTAPTYSVHIVFPAEADTYATLYTGCPSFAQPFFLVVYNPQQIHRSSLAKIRPPFYNLLILNIFYIHTIFNIVY